MSITREVNNTVEWLLRRSRRLDRYYRDAFDHIARDRILAITQFLVNVRRRNEGLLLGEERLMPGEEKLAAQITEQMSTFLRRTYTRGAALRAGNTKTHGLVRGIFEVLPDLAPDLAHGLFATPQRYRAWVRFAGPGPHAPADLDDNGVLSMSVKVMGVPGRKLMDDEQLTQDFTAISARTFTTPNVVENLKLQRWIGAGTPAMYFINPFDPHLLDAIMQGLFSRAHASPLELAYHSCVPYCMGEGRAMKYELRPDIPQRSRIPRRPGPNYLRDAMSRTLLERDVFFDLLIQLQTDAYRMPLENSSVIWPQHLSPLRPVARLRIPRQSFMSREQLAFDRHLSFNPWHALPAHRPLGNQNRARRVIYQATSKVRQNMNDDARIEPTGLEIFPQSPPLELEPMVMR